MRICVVGAGAIGGLLAARLGADGHEVTVVARGETLAAIRDGGITLHEIDGSITESGPIEASEDPSTLGGHDVVFIALKAHQLAPLAPALETLRNPDGVFVPLQNGIPWWYFERHGGPHEGRQLHSLDPEGTLGAAIAPESLVGCIAYPAAERSGPASVVHIEGDRFPVGEPDGSRSDRAEALAAALKGAGFKSRVLTDIRTHIWVKALGNLSFNPISALTGATLGEICTHPATRDLAARMMTEAMEIAEALDVTIRLSIEQRIEGAAAVGDHKTSMLQDVEAGRALELDPLVGVFVELGRLVGVDTPAIEVVYGLTSLLDHRLRGGRS